MPKRSRKSDYKSRPWKRRRKYRRSARIKKAPGMLGKTFCQKFRYCDQLELSATAGVPSVHSFRINSLYDPDFSGTGHQPIGFDQLMGFYEHYCVLGAKLSATFVASNADPVQGSVICGIELSGNSTPTTALNDIFEQGNSRYRTLTNSNASGLVNVTHKVNLSKFLGQKVLQEDANSGTASSNPTEVVWMHVFVAPVDVGVTTHTAYVNIKLDQIAVLHEPKPLAGS